MLRTWNLPSFLLPILQLCPSLPQRRKTRICLCGISEVEPVANEGLHKLPQDVSPCDSGFFALLGIRPCSPSLFIELCFHCFPFFRRQGDSPVRLSSNYGPHKQLLKHTDFTLSRGGCHATKGSGKQTPDKGHQNPSKSHRWVLP